MAMIKASGWPEWRLLWVRFLESFRRIVNAIPEEQRSVINLVLEGIEVNEIAARLKVDRTTVWRWQIKAFKTIRAKLADDGWKREDIWWLLSRSWNDWR